MPKGHLGQALKRQSIQENSKMLVDQSLVDDRNVIYMVLKKTFTAKQVQNILQDVGVHVSLSV